jgi:hypothetical protein
MNGFSEIMNNSGQTNNVSSQTMDGFSQFIDNSEYKYLFLTINLTMVLVKCIKMNPNQCKTATNDSN